MIRSKEASPEEHDDDVVDDQQGFSEPLFPQQQLVVDSHRFYLFPMSAATQEGLDQQRATLLNDLRRRSRPDEDDDEYDDDDFLEATSAALLRQRRPSAAGHRYRAYALVRNGAELRAALECDDWTLKNTVENGFKTNNDEPGPGLAFLFPPQGVQHAGMLVRERHLSPALDALFRQKCRRFFDNASLVGGFHFDNAVGVGVRLLFFLIPTHGSIINYSILHLIFGIKYFCFSTTFCQKIG
jgi:acyl transferase domain-containing protein